MSVGILLLNRDAGSEERAALSEALYHALKHFLTDVQDAIAITTNDNRSFEAVVLSDSFQHLATLPCDIDQNPPWTYYFSGWRL